MVKILKREAWEKVMTIRGSKNGGKEKEQTVKMRDNRDVEGDNESLISWSEERETIGS